MTNKAKRRGRFRLATLSVSLLPVAFLFARADKACAQCQWTSGTNTITQTCGNVGIGISTPTALLNLRVTSGDVIQRFTNAGNAGGELDVRYKYESALHRIGLADSAGNWLFWTQYASPNTASVGHFPGNVAIGTTSPQKPLHVIATNYSTGIAVGKNDNLNLLLFGYDTTNNVGAIGSYAGGSGSTLTLNRDGGNVGIGTTTPSTKLHVAGGDLNVTGTGSVSLTSAGHITASGTIQGGNVIAKYQDVAEWVPASRAIPAGTVVTLDPERSNHVLASSRAYDTRVAGVVSASPGVLLGEGGIGKVMVATTGRVRVKVDATLAPIRVGDLLVTSDKEGIAMRSQPLDLGGTPIHRPGTLIGKALEPLEKGVGEILVLLSLQ